MIILQKYIKTILKSIQMVLKTQKQVVAPARGTEVNRRTSNTLAVYTVEMVAILVALRWVEKTEIVKVVITPRQS